MKRSVYVILFFVSSIFCDYIASVVEYSPIIFQGNATTQDAQQTMLKNLDNYEIFIQDAKKQNAQIIVFPEDGLYGPVFPTRESIFPFLEFIPNVDPNAQVIPCGDPSFNDRPVLQRSSCLAQKYEIVLVLDMGDIQPCNTDCPSDGHFQYNTLVAFSETGQLLAKYHKSHLYGEPQFDQPPVPEVVYFDTSFGVRFGMIICFDIMFEYPQGSLLEMGITNFVFGAWWVNFPPVITATQVQQSNSLIHNIALLASNSGESWYNSGSGIYVNGKPLATYYYLGYKPSSKLFVAQVEEQEVSLKLDEPTACSPLNDFGQCYGDFAPNAKEFMPFENPTGQLTVTYEDLVCEASYSVSNAYPNETFGLIAYKGSFSLLTNVSICGIVKCSPGGSCGAWAVNSNTVFSSFTVSGNIADSLHVYPLFAANNTEVIDISQWESQGNEIKSSEGFSSTLMNASLFALYWPICE